MKKIVSAASAVLLAMSLAACNADEAKEVEVPASTIASQTKAEDTEEPLPAATGNGQMKGKHYA